MYLLVCNASKRTELAESISILKVDKSTKSMRSRFINKLIKLIILEKQLAREELSYERFTNKFIKVTDIYDVRGSDCMCIATQQRYTV